MRFMTGLRAFHYTARLGGVTAAAHRMGVSQPTVSTHIAALERCYGVELFFQVGRRLVPTEFSEGLLTLTDRLFELEEEVQGLLSDAHGVQSGHLRVAAVGPYNVMPVLAEFRRWYPGVLITLSVGDSRQIVERIRSYQADVGVLVHNVRDDAVESIPYRRQKLVVFGHHTHRLARRTSLRMADLEGEDLVCREAGSTTQEVFDAALREAGVKINRVMEIGSRESVREAVACGIGLGVVSEIAYIPDRRLTPLLISDLNAYTHSHVICLRERLRSRLLAAFIHLLNEMRTKGAVASPDAQASRAGTLARPARISTRASKGRS